MDPVLSTLRKLRAGAASGTGAGASRRAARAVCASPMPTRTTRPPSTCQPESTCSTHTQATTEASTGSTVAISPAVVGGRWRSAARDSQNGSTAPRTTIQPTSTHSGSSSEPSETGTEEPSTAGSNGQNGAATAQNSAAATKLQQVSATGSRVVVPRSPIR